MAVAVALETCHAGAVEQAEASLVDFSLEQLSDIVVTSVSRQETRLAEAPASIYSISGAEIRRSMLGTPAGQDIRVGGANLLARFDSRLADGSALDPSHYWSLRSSHDLADDVQADFMLRHVGSLPDPALPAYTELDVRMAWQRRRHLALSLAGQNLLHEAHPEFGAPGVRHVVERAVALRLALRF